MVEHKLLTKLSIGIVSLALICPLALGGISNSTVANARRRPRTHRAYHHHRRGRSRRHAHKIYGATHHHKSAATWYKHNALKMYDHKINRNHMFRRGFIDGVGGIDPDGSDILVYKNGSGGGNQGEGSIERRYAHNSQYKHGWIISNPLGLYYTIETKGKIKGTTKSDYKRSLHRWHAGIDYLKANNQAGLIDYDNDDGQWSRDPADPYAKIDHQQNPFY